MWGIAHLAQPEINDFGANARPTREWIRSVLGKEKMGPLHGLQYNHLRGLGGGGGHARKPSTIYCVGQVRMYGIIVHVQ